MSDHPAPFADRNRLRESWGVSIGESHRLGDEAFRREALTLARTLMRRARIGFERIIERLVRENYEFETPREVHTPPERLSLDWIRDVREIGVHVPVSVEAFLREVGNINLVGTHPGWSKPAIATWGRHIEGDYLIADPFVCEITEDYVQYLHDEWQADRPHPLEPFCIDFSPDHLHKANISGGAPYGFRADQPAVDCIVLNERHWQTFMAHVRLALQWRGFPGFESIPDEGEWSRCGNSPI